MLPDISRLEEFTEQLSQRLSMPLPGREAQFKMASSFRSPFPKKDFSDAKLGGVLILLYPYQESIHTVLMVRPSYDGVHSGQVSFPGGKKEDSDADLIQTALREAEEETGMRPSDIKVIGTLTELYIPPSNFLVLPVVGYSAQKPHFIPDPVEVVELIEAPLSLFFDETIRGEKEIVVRNDFRFLAPYFDVYGNVVWGATAMIISEMLEVIRSIEK